MTITGKIHEIGTTQAVSDKFSKRDIVLEYAENPQYPEYIKLELHQDKTSLADKFKVGQMVVADFNLKGKPWTNKQGVTQYFNSLVIWKLTEADKDAVQPKAFSQEVEAEDDLPF